MRLNRLMAALAIVLGFAVMAQAAPKGTKAVPSKKKQPGQTVRGIVLEVHHEKNKDRGEIKIKVQVAQPTKKKSKSAAAAAVTKKTLTEQIVTVHVNQATKYEKVVHHQGTVVRHTAAFTDVRKGEHARVVLGAKNQHAREVDLVIHQHKKAPPKKPVKKKK